MRKFSLLSLILTLFAVPLLAQSTGGLKGRVRTASGSGIGGASVVVRQDGKDLREASADGRGRFEITGLAEGRYNLVFDAPGYASGILHRVEVRKGVVRDLGDGLILSPDRGTLVIVNGSVYSKEGASLSGAQVKVERVNADGSTEKLMDKLYTNYTGEFTFRQPAKTAKLRVTATYKGVSAAKEVEVDMAAIYRLSIILDISRADK